MNKKGIDCKQAEMLMMGLLDGELNEKQLQEVKTHLAQCPACAANFESYKKLKKETNEMKFKNLPEVYWDEYWQNVYNRIERGIGWIFFSIGAIILLIFAGYELLQEFFLNPAESLSVKIGVGFAGVGFIVLFVSVLREKLMVRKVDKYRSVKR